MDMLAKLNQAHKAITTTSSLGDSKLVAQQQNTFIRVATEATPLLDEARRIDMTSHTRNIDRISMTGRMLRSVGERESVQEGSSTAFYTNKLIAQEVGGWFGLTDETLEDNIEREQLENTIVNMAGERAGKDLADLFLNGDTGSSDPLYQRTDGWFKKAANQLADTDFDPADVEDLFARMIEVIDKRYLDDPADWTFWTDWSTMNDYQDILRGRNTALGDRAQTSNMGLNFKGFEIRYDAHMKPGAALLAPDDNRVWGVHRDVRIEPERKAKDRETHFVLTTRADCHFEDENAAVVAEGYTGESTAA